MFAALDESDLIQRGLGPLTQEAREALTELLAERGLAGHALDLKVAEVRRSLFERSGVTNHCDYCGKSVILQPVRRGAQKFCSQRCSEDSMLSARAATLAPDLVYQHAIAMKFGECPCCQRGGRQSVDMRLWSAMRAHAIPPYRSSQYGFVSSMSLSFHSRFHSFRAFSRAMADGIVSCDSYQTNVWTR